MQQTNKINSTIVLLIAAVIVIFGNKGSPNNASNEKDIKKTYVIRQTGYEFKTEMRKLWEEHSYWTRNVILCIVDDLPGTEQAVKRLLQNQVDIGNAIKPYYGEETGDKLTELLYPHIIIGEEVIKAMKSGNIKVLEEANKRWYANADEIAEFLCNSNPHWESYHMKLMMHDHLKLTSDAVTQRVKKDYGADVEAHDKARQGILDMSDMLAEGIIKQFQEKF